MEKRSFLTDQAHYHDAMVIVNVGVAVIVRRVETYIVSLPFCLSLANTGRGEMMAHVLSSSCSRVLPDVAAIRVVLP